jgi:hypothetical protein
MGETTPPITEDVKPVNSRHACPHCGKMVAFPAAAVKGLGPIKTDTKNSATKAKARRAALEGKVSKGLHAAFPTDTNASDNVS